METHGYCYTKRGIGTFVMQEETMFETIKKEMAEELLSSFIHEMQDLGFEKDEKLQTTRRREDDFRMS
jgi:GntR family transcriptional regulator